MSARRIDSSGPINGWTVHTLHTYMERLIDERDHQYEQRFRGQQESVTAALAAAEKALDKAETATEKRFDSVNEFRQVLTDQTATFPTKTDLRGAVNTIDTKIEGMTKDIEALKLCTSSTEGRHTGMGVVVAYVIGAVGIIIAVISLVLRAVGF